MNVESVYQVEEVAVTEVTTNATKVAIKLGIYFDINEMLAKRIRHVCKHSSQNIHHIVSISTRKCLLSYNQSDR